MGDCKDNFLTHLILFDKLKAFCCFINFYKGGGGVKERDGRGGGARGGGPPRGGGVSHGGE